MRERPRRKETNFSYFALAEPVATEPLRGEASLLFQAAKASINEAHKALAQVRERLKKPYAP